MKPGITALAVSALVGFGSSAYAAELTVNSLGGIWQDATASVSGEGTSEIRWGDPATSFGQSGYDYDAATVPILATDEVPFVLGEFTHHNLPIWGSRSFDVDLVIEFEVVGVADPVTSVFSFNHWETTNWDQNNRNAPCSNGANWTGVNVNGCADRVIATLNESRSESFEIDGVRYILDILGFQYQGQTLTSFWTTEEAENIAQLLAVFRVVETPEVPLPASGLLLLGGLGGLIVARRRRA